MSFQGQSPRVNRIRYTPQSSAPVNPTEGDSYFSDGTERPEGIWVYRNGDWVSAGGGDIATEVIEFLPYITCRAATTTNIDTATELENGDTLDGVVLATGNLVLVKNQTTASQNGVYVVPASGAASRYTGADSAAELTYASAAVQEGTVNACTGWFQNNVLATLSDNQSWASTPATRDFEVPAAVTVLWVELAGAGGGGGSGGRVSGSNVGGGGSGGAGVNPIEYMIPVTPGEILTITLGKGGVPIPVSNTDFGLAGDGSITSVVALAGAAYSGGGAGGMSGETDSGSNTALGGDASGTYTVRSTQALSGDGGWGDTAVATNTHGSAGTGSSFASGGAGGTKGTASSGTLGGGGGGGGGGAGLGNGGAGGNGAGTTGTSPTTPTVGANGGRSAGGGGGGGGSAVANGMLGGFGGHGFVRITY